jgi:hypothetical protein
MSYAVVAWRGWLVEVAEPSKGFGCEAMLNPEEQMNQINAKSTAWVGFVGIATATVLAAGTASAQTAAAPAAAAPAAAPVAAPAPPPPPPPAMAAHEGGLDRDMWIGHLGIGWLGTRQVPIGALAAGAPAIAQIGTPIIGARYWLNPNIGIDAGLGFFTSSGSQTVENAGVSVSTDKASQTSFVLHGGVPIALGLEGKHYSFQITPELDFGFSTGSSAPAAAPAPKSSLSGLMLQMGARAGAEIFFGFIGIPALSLEGSVGLFLSYQSAKVSTDAYVNAGGLGVPATSFKDSTLLIGTSAMNNPWQIFTSNVAARYYF